METIRDVEGAGSPNLKVGNSPGKPLWVIQCQDRITDVVERFLYGFEATVAAAAKEVAIFASASESFSKSNINCSIEDSLIRYRDVALAAKKLIISVCGYTSCVVGCPVEGKVSPTQVVYEAKELYNMAAQRFSQAMQLALVPLVLLFQCLKQLLKLSP